jgi:predicted transcriptional regulator
MTKDQIRVVLDRVRNWPLDQQAELARIAEFIEAQSEQIEPEDGATRAAIAEGFAQIERGEFATEDEVEAAFARFRK